MATNILNSQTACKNKQYIDNTREGQRYLGHSRVEKTMIYTHVVRALNPPAESPLDLL